MEIDAKAFKELINNLKPIFSKAGSQFNPEWLLIENNTIYSRNGYFYGEVSSPKINIDNCVIVNGLQVLSLLSRVKEKDVVTIEAIKEKHCKIIFNKKTVEFNAPLDKETFFKDFYTPDIDSQEFKEVAGIKEAIGYTFETVFAKNIEFSNVYAVSGVLVSSDGVQITTATAEGMPDTSIPIGTDKVLFFDPTHVHACDQMVTFERRGDEFYRVSATKNIGNASALIRIVPKETPTKTCKLNDTIKDILSTGASLDHDFKKQDSMIEVNMRDSMVQCRLNGRKTKFYEETLAEFDAPISFNINPSYFLSGCKISDEFKYEEGLDFIQFDAENVNRLVSIETG